MGVGKGRSWVGVGCGDWGSVVVRYGGGRVVVEEGGEEMKGRVQNDRAALKTKACGWSSGDDKGGGGGAE